MATITPGTTAYVDAGKTSPTEHILLATGVISSVDNVERGTTRTGTSELARPRGIGVTYPVVAFRLNQRRAVQLIDTSGHADLIAEVEHSLGVLDGVLLMGSAVMGRQLHTRRLAQAVRASARPMLLFINDAGQSVTGARPRRCS